MSNLTRGKIFLGSREESMVDTLEKKNDTI